MIRKENEKAGELTDDEIEKAVGGGEASPVAKRCMRCIKDFDLSLNKCPACGWGQYWFVYLPSPMQQEAN